MLKNYLKIIEKDFWNSFSYELKSWWDFNVFIVDKKYIYRFPKKDKNIQDLKDEKNITEIVSKYTNFSIPKLEIVSDKNIYWFKYDIINWETMEEFNFQQISLKNLEIFLDDIVKFLKNIHLIPLKEIGFLDKKDYMNDWYKNHLKNWVEKKLIWKMDKKYIDKIFKYLDILFNLKFEKKSFIHSDVQWKNIIFDYNKNKINWFIDFSDCKVSWIEYDFCHFLKWWDEIFEKIVEKYFWKSNKKFSDRVKFLAKKEIIFEILNDEIFKKDFLKIENKIKISF